MYRILPMVILSVVLVNVSDKISLRFVIVKYNIPFFQYCRKIIYIFTVVSETTNVELLGLVHCVLSIISIAPGTRVHIVMTNIGLN
jgi:hypothetical protein